MVDQKVALPITGMTCVNCAMNIERTVKKLNGIKDANVNFAAEQAVVAFDPKLLHLSDIVDNIHDSGYTVAKAKVELPVTGMTCANCAMNIERALNRKVPGVINASVNFATERVY
ncbi:MAG: heavy metal translocating P-type ATPase, partial [Deltaproteobacteria bacterium]|nr:heavy metal translocating P-type ATPase [Deltaproteobacteria bacterium]